MIYNAHILFKGTVSNKEYIRGDRAHAKAFNKRRKDKIPDLTEVGSS